MKVVSTSPSFSKYSKEPIEYLNNHGIDFAYLPSNLTEDEFIQSIQDVDALIVAFDQINQQVLDHAPRLKIVCKHGVGVDNIDLKATKEKNVWATNVPNANKHAVADFAFSLMLSLARQIPLANQLTKEGKWPRIFGTDVFGKTIGIVGLGMIGKEVARRAKGFEMEILAYDPYPNTEYAKENNIKPVELNELLEKSDFVTLHLPLTNETRNLIDTEQFNLMKESGYLVNASRGGIVNEDALYNALVNKKIAGAALDVFVKEPLYEHPLYELDNFIGLPHIAGYTSGAVNSLGMTCAKNIVKVLVEGTRPDFIVNGL